MESRPYVAEIPQEYLKSYWPYTGYISITWRQKLWKDGAKSITYWK